MKNNKSHSIGPSNLVVVGTSSGGGVLRRRRNLDDMSDDSNHSVRGLLIKVEEDNTLNNDNNNNNNANTTIKNGISSQAHAAQPRQQSSTVVQVKQEEDVIVEEGTKPIVPPVSTNYSGLTTMGITILDSSEDKEEDSNDNNNNNSSNNIKGTTEEGTTSSLALTASMTIINKAANIIKNRYDESSKGKTHKTTGDNNNYTDETKLSTIINTTMLDDGGDPYDAMADLAANSHLRAATAIAIPLLTAHNTKTETASGSVATSLAITTSTESMSISHQQQQPIIVTASMSNHYVPPRIYRAGSLTSSNSTSNRKYKHSRNFSGGSGDVNNNVTQNNQSSSNDDNNKNRQQQASIHMLQSVGLECGDDGILRLDQFDDDDDDDDCDDNNIAIKDENETTKKEASSTTGDTNTADALTRLLKQPKSTWTPEQHKAFVTAIFEIGMKNCSPSIIMENMRKQPRYITRERTKSHLQKYRQTKERSRNEFLKDYDAFFKSTEQAKIDLVTTMKKSSSSFPAPDQSNNQSSDQDKNQQQPENNTTKEPIPKAVLTAALDGKKPSKLLGGRAAALLSYSVLNNFSTDYGPDQLQYKAAKLQEFPIMTEEEKRTSVGSSLLQVKSLLDNMTDALLKSRHGIKNLSRDTRGGIKDEDSVASSILSSDDGYSDDDEDCGDVGMEGKEDKRSLANAHSHSKDQDSIATATNRRRPPFGMGVGSSHPSHPSLYQGGPAAVYPATAYSAGQQVPPPAPSGFPPQPYSHPHAPQSFYGGGLPAAALAPGGAPPGYGPTSFHPSTMHYTQDPRLNPYQQPPAGSYPAVPPQATYYPSVATTAGYPAYYDGTNSEYHPRPATAASVDPYSRQQLRSVGSSTVYGNDGQWHAGGRPYEMFDLAEGSPNNNKSSGRRAEKRLKRRRDRSRHSEKPSLAIDVASSSRNKNCVFMDRVSKVPSPTKLSRRTSSSPMQSRKHRRTKSSSSTSTSSTSSSSINNDNPTGRYVGHSSSSHRNTTSSSNKPTRKRSRPQQHQQFDTPAAVDSSARGPRHISSETYTNSFGSPADPFSEGELSHFVASPYENSPVHAAAEDTRNRPHNPNSQMWGGPTSFMDAGFNDQQQLNQGGGFEQQQQQQLQLQQPDHNYPDQQQHRRYDGVDGQHVDDGYIQKAASFSPSPQGGGGTDSSDHYFFGE